MYRDNPKPFVFSTSFRQDHEVEVKPHLAYTIAEAAECIAQGKPISSANMASVYEGEVGDNMEIELDQRRGVDINDLWNEKERVARTRRKYGNVSVTQSINK